MSNLLPWDAAMVIGERVIEMADRLRTLDKVVPGSTAKDCVELDGMEFEIVMRVKPAST